MASQFDLVFNALNGFRSGTRGQICFGWGDQCGIGWPQGHGDDHDPQHNYRRSHVESQKRTIKVIALNCSSWENGKSGRKSVLFIIHGNKHVNGKGTCFIAFNWVITQLPSNHLPDTKIGRGGRQIEFPEPSIRVARLTSSLRSGC